MEQKNKEQLVEAFSNALEIDKNMVDNDLKYQGIPQWDSITHMILISEIESTFHIEIDADDVLEMSSFQKTKEILEKYNL